MPTFLQHLLVLTVVAGCIAWVAWQSFQSLRGRKSRIGSCCAKGCSPVEPTAKPAEKGGERVVFIPVDMLTARARRNSR